VKNKFRRALLERVPTFGAWQQLGHPGVTEILANIGFDWICIDLEHGAIDLETMTNLFRTMEAYDCVPVARLPLNDPVWIHRTLDAGAQGLIIPMIKTAEEAEAAVSEAKFPPRGRRGFGYSRANRHGANFEGYCATANEEIAMVMQIEHKDAIQNLDAILAVDGVDGLFIGPLDLSGSLGVTGQMKHPDVVAALRLHLEACQRHGCSAGMHVVTPNEDSIRESIEAGYTMIALGLDNTFLMDAASKAFSMARSIS